MLAYGSTSHTFQNIYLNTGKFKSDLKISMEVRARKEPHVRVIHCGITVIDNCIYKQCLHGWTSHKYFRYYIILFDVCQVVVL